MSKKGLGKFALGAVVGAALGLLLAPEKGDKTRQKVKNSSVKLLDEIKKLDYNEIRDNLMQRLESIEDEIRSLDKDKVAAITKEKGDELIKKANTLYKEAVKAGKPMLEKYAKELKEQTRVLVNNLMENKETTNDSSQKKGNGKK